MPIDHIVHYILILVNIGEQYDNTWIHGIVYVSMINVSPCKLPFF